MVSLRNYKLHLKQYSILSNGADGGHKYIVGEIIYKGQPRRISIFFTSKNDEKKLVQNSSIDVEGDFKDDGNEDLLLSNSRLI